MTVSAPLRWLGILFFALASLGCGLLDQLTDSEDGQLTIQRFSASPVTIAPGSPTTLTWEVEGSDSVSIDNGIGAVPAKGSRQVQPGATTTYNMTAQSGSSQATASVQVQVQGSPTPSPSPSPTATPSATPSATPTPTVTPVPQDGTPTPTPTPTAVPPACGAPSGNAGNCAVVIAKPNPIEGGGCVEVNVVTVSQSCPVALSLPILLRFDVTALTPRPTLTWRRAPGNNDILQPGEGVLDGSGSTTVLVTDVVLDDAAEIEILDAGTVVLTLAVGH
jgi:hypothetical protein